eukprot:45472_1
MDLIVMDDSTKESLYQVFSISHMVVWALILVYHVVSMYWFNRFEFQTNYRSIYGSFLLIALAFLVNLALVLTTFDPVQSQTFCDIGQFIGYSSYIAFKCTLYLLLVSRLHDAFHNSTLSYNPKYLFYWAAALVLCNTINIGLGWRYLTFSFRTDIFPTCVHQFPLWLPASFCMVDLVSSVVNSYLFVKPLSTLKQSVVDKDSVKELESVALKQCVLSITACSTTVMVMVLMALLNWGPVIIPMDTNISTWCIIAMYKWNNRTFKTICYCFTRNVATKDMSNLEKAIPTNTSTRSTPTTKNGVDQASAKDMAGIEDV